MNDVDDTDELPAPFCHVELIFLRPGTQETELLEHDLGFAFFILAAFEEVDVPMDRLKKIVLTSTDPRHAVEFDMPIDHLRSEIEYL